MSEEKSLMWPGHAACSGCGATILAKHVLEIMTEKTIMVVPASCWTIINGVHPYKSVKIPVFNCAFAAAAATAGGIRAGLNLRGDTETNVIVFAGDGGTFDIGLQALSAAAERGEDIIYFCYDNEAYMNTGNQRSSATSLGAWTTTTPAGRPTNERKKDIMQIMTAHRIPYAATATLAFVDDLKAKTQKAKDLKGKGLRFIHLLSPCPTGWKFDPRYTVKIARLAVETGVFPLYEVEMTELNGWGRQIKKFPVSKKAGKTKPVEEYLKTQGRFSHLTKEDIERIQEEVSLNIIRLTR